MLFLALENKQDSSETDTFLLPIPDFIRCIGNFAYAFAFCRLIALDQLRHIFNPFLNDTPYHTSVGISSDFAKVRKKSHTEVHTLFLIPAVIRLHGTIGFQSVSLFLPLDPGFQLGVDLRIQFHPPVLTV